MKSVSHSVVSDSATLRTVTHQGPLFVGFSRQEAHMNIYKLCHPLSHRITFLLPLTSCLLNIL